MTRTDRDEFDCCLASPGYLVNRVLSSLPRSDDPAERLELARALHEALGQYLASQILRRVYDESSG